MTYIFSTLIATLPAAAMRPVDPEQAGRIALFYGILVITGLAVNLYLFSRAPEASRTWNQKKKRLVKRPLDWMDLAHLVFLVVVGHIVLLGAYYTVDLLGWTEEARERGVWFLGHSVAMHWIPLAFLVFLIIRKRVTWRDAFGGSGKGLLIRIGQGIALYTAVVPAVVFYMVIYQIWLKFTGHEPKPQDVVRLFMEMEPGTLRIYLIVLAVILAPIVEELVFRGMAMPVFSRVVGVAPAIVLVSAAFAVMHAHIPSMVPLFIFGIALSLAYIHTESILVPIVMHMAFNGVTLGIMIHLGYL